MLMALTGNLNCIPKLCGFWLKKSLLISLIFQVSDAKCHLTLTTSLSKIRKERFQPNILVPLQRIVSKRDKSRCASHSQRNCPLTILCRENQPCHRSTSILLKREMILQCPNQMFLKRNTIVLIIMFIVIMITTIKWPMIITIITQLRRIMFMVYLMAPLVEIHLLAKIHMLRQVHLLSHLLACEWLRRTNSSSGLCLRWIRMGHGQWLH